MFVFKLSWLPWILVFGGLCPHCSDQPEVCMVRQQKRLLPSQCFLKT